MGGYLKISFFDYLYLYTHDPFNLDYVLKIDVDIWCRLVAEGATNDSVLTITQYDELNGFPNHFIVWKKEK